MNRQVTDYAVNAQKGRCLTELSIPVLVAGALGLSAMLWLAIVTVL